MMRRALAVLVLLVLLSMFAGAAAPCWAEGEPWFNGYNAWWEHHVWWDGSESWMHYMGACADDPLGPENIAGISVTDPQGTVHPAPGETFWGPDFWSDPCGWRVEYGEEFGSPPDFFGMYTFVAENLQGKTATAYCTLDPFVGDPVPTITYPDNLSVISETVPLFSWASLPDADLIHVSVLKRQADGWEPLWTTWDSEPLPPGQTSVAYNFNGTAPESELTPGHTYLLQVGWQRLLAGGGTAWIQREVLFTVAPGPESAPVLPPDSEGKIAYSSALESWRFGWIRVYDLDAPGWIALGIENDGAPAAGVGDWAPDGTQLMYHRVVGDPDAGICSTLIDSLDGAPPVEVPGALGFDERWAPDGESIAYTRYDATAQYDIWSTAVDGSDAHSLVDSEWRERFPDWSPDGRWIAYTASDKPGGQNLWLVRCDGTDDHPVFAAGIEGEEYAGYEVEGMGIPAWRPDGATLAVSFSMSLPGGSWPDDWLYGIGLISPEGGDSNLIRPVFVAPPGGICCATPGWPAWSPDGTKLLFSSGHHLADPVEWGFEPRMELWVAEVNGTLQHPEDLVRVTYNETYDECVSWWAPNTHYGLSQSVTVGNVTATYEEVVAEGSTIIIVTDDLPAPPPGDLTFVEDFTYHLATTATISGAVTVAVDYGETAYPPVLGERLSLLLWDGAEWVDITTAIDTAGYVITGQFAPGAGSDWYVALALDRPGVPEVKVMFDGCTEGRPSGPGLFVADGDFSNPVRVTLPGPGTALEPECVCSCGTIASAWSPDGSQVVMERTSAGTLEVMDLAALIQAPAQESVPLTDEYGDPVRGHMPNWSSSGDRIVYVSTADLFEFDGIAVVNADGTGQHMIYAFPGPDLPPSARWVKWSPDGTRILFQMGDAAHGGCHLYVLEDTENPGGATLRQLTADDAWAEDQPHWSPDGRYIAFARSAYGTTVWRGSDIWVIDVETGVERRITDSPEIGKAAQGWCPYDGYVYFGDNACNLEKRILPDGTGEEALACYPGGQSGPGERLSWIPSGVWIDALNALPGESVTAKMGIADAANLAGVQAKVRYTGGSDSLTFDSILKAESIPDWAMPSPVIGADVASFLGYAADPETQAVSGDHYLFDLNVTNSPTAHPGDLQLLTFDDLKLSDDWGDPVDRISFGGGVHTIPFAYLEVSSITSPVCADADDPLPFTVMLTAMDWDGLPMADCDVTVEFETFSWSRWPKTAMAVTPTSVALVDGSWSGEVSLLEPYPWHQLFAHWGDFAGYSNWFQAIGKGDTNADNRITIFDVVKVANMAIERGEWADWQWWAGDLNRDHEVNIFDVVMCANAAMEAMEAMGIGRAGAPSVVAPPSEPVIVTTDVSTSGGQVVVAVKLSNCAGLAGVQVELGYDAKKLAYTGVSAGELLTGASSWSVMGNDLGSRVKAIAYTPSAEVLSGGEGTILTFTFNQTGKGKAKVSLTSVALADVEGGEIPSQTSGGKGRGKGKTS